MKLPYGTLARNADGELGVITGHKGGHALYEYFGVCLSDENYSQPWVGNDPEIVGFLIAYDDLPELCFDAPDPKCDKRSIQDRLRCHNPDACDDIRSDAADRIDKLEAEVADLRSSLEGIGLLCECKAKQSEGRCC